MSLRNSQTSFHKHQRSPLKLSSRLKNSSTLSRDKTPSKSPNKSFYGVNYSKLQNKLTKSSSTKSNSSQVSGSPSKRFNYKDYSGFQIVSESEYSGNNNSSTIVSKLGLKLESVCQKPYHDRQKVSFICTNLDCKEDRLCCATCILESHTDHVEEKCRIDDYLKQLDTNYKEYYNDLNQFKEQSDILQNPPFLTEIMNQMDEIKLYMSTKIEDTKLQILRDYEKLINNQCMQFNQQVQQQKVFSVNIDNILLKNMFQMTDEDINSSIQLWHKVENKKIQETSHNVQTRVAELQKLFKNSFDNYKNNFKNQFDYVYEDYKNLDLPDYKNDLEQKLIYLKNKKHSLEKIIQPFEQLQGQIENLKKDIVNTESNLGLFAPHNCDDINKQLPITIATTNTTFQSHQGSPLRGASPLRKVLITQTTNSPSRTIQDNSKNSIKHTHSKDNQQQNLSTVPIFECCQQAFKCQQCHDNFNKNHKAVISNPSKRYCLKCQQIFTVNLTQSTSVPCVYCIPKSQLVQVQQPKQITTTTTTIQPNFNTLPPKQLIITKKHI